MVAGASFAQKTTVLISNEDYQILKKEGKLKSGTTYIANNQTALMDTKPNQGQLKNGACNCLIPLDNTFSLAMTQNDDWSSGYISLPFSFDFYGTTYDSVVINNNGNISFLAPYFEYTANAFPDPSFNMIAPFWGDVDTRSPNGGNVWYKVTNDALIVIWDHVGYYDQHDDLVNTFQLVISNGNDTIIHGNNNVSFCYGDMQWTTGDASFGVGGVGGSPANVGVNIGNGIDFFQVGLFDNQGYFFDGPTGANDQVDFLDDQEIYFDLAGMASSNLPPLVINSNICDTIDVYTGDTLHKNNTTVSFEISVLTPEVGQVLDAQIYSDAPNSLTITEGGNGMTYISYDCQFNAEGLLPGMYHVTVIATDNGQPAQQTTYEIPIRVNEAGIARVEDHNLENFTLYPNPSDGHIYWDHSDFSWKDMVVYRIDGTKVLQIKSASNELDLSFLSEGMYLLKAVTMDNKQIIRKFQIVK